MFKHIKKILVILLILSFYELCCYKIYKTETKNTNKININKEIQEVKDDNIGKLIIDKININNNLYPLDSNKNNIEQNITILNGSINPKESNSIMFIAAHSGTGDIAYFNDLDKLEINDEVILEYENNTYKYIVESIWETDKDGDIEVTKENNKQLILTTCSPSHKDKQLVVNCTIKES